MFSIEYYLLVNLNNALFICVKNNVVKTATGCLDLVLLLMVNEIRLLSDVFLCICN
jgi:hypothetical protein